MASGISKHLNHQLFDYSNNPQEKFRHVYCVINISCKKCGLSWKDRIYKHGLYGCLKCDGSYEHFVRKNLKRNRKIISLLSKKRGKLLPTPSKKFTSSCNNKIRATVPASSTSDNMSDLLHSFSNLRIKPLPFDQAFSRMTLD